jgi:HEAT repeat protein
VVAALGQCASDEALQPLQRALAASEPARRSAAASALARWGREPAIDLLQWAAAADADADVTQAALHGLARIGDGSSTAAARAIGALAAVASDPARYDRTVGALARVSAAAIPRVGACLSSRDPRVRHAVVEALARLSHPAASAYLRSALADSEPIVRQHAVVVLARLGSRGVARSFAEMAANDPSDMVRRAAAAALRRSHADVDAVREARP